MKGNKVMEITELFKMIYSFKKGTITLHQEDNRFYFVCKIESTDGSSLTGIKVSSDYNEALKDILLKLGFTNNIDRESSIEKVKRSNKHKTKNGRYLYLTLNGETQTLSEWSRKLNVSVTTLHARIKRGWTDEEVLTIPLDKRYMINGKRKNRTPKVIFDRELQFQSK